jgi:hypothetical protein
MKLSEQYIASYLMQCKHLQLFRLHQGSHVWRTATVVFAAAAGAIPLLASLQKQCGMAAATTAAVTSAVDNAILTPTSATFAAATNSGRVCAAEAGATRHGGRYPSPS